MNIFSRNKITIWILAGALVLALSALGTMIYHRYCCPLPDNTPPSCTTGCRLMKDELNLSEKQAKDIDRIRAHHRNVAMVTSDSLRLIRSEIVSELSKEAPDSIRLHQLAMTVGRLQALLTDQAINQYLHIRKECSPRQREKLSSLYYELMGCCPAGQGKKMHRQCGRK